MDVMSKLPRLIDEAAELDTGAVRKSRGLS